MCRGAAAEGAKVLVTARSQEAIEALAGEIRNAGGEAQAMRCDVGKTEDCEGAAKFALEQWGRIDGLVHSAYYHPDWASLDVHSIDQLMQAFDVVAAGGLRMAQAVIPTMKEQGSGSIVNISTLATRKPMPGEGGYAMAKAALAQMTRQLAIELGGTGIRVNTAAMGWMDGKPLDSYFASMGEQGEAFRKQREREVPVGHIPPDKDCAKAVYFLLSDYASEMTGAAIDVNGGDWVAI
jgi:NAD(P)-dependent dehydrogenase (short-subunit alcohol dehydrogenase family)